MKTSIDYVVLTEIDEFNQERESVVRIRDGNNRLMVDRVIKIFSQNPKEHIRYNKSLENEIYHDYRDQLEKGLLITVSLHNEQITKEYFDAVYGEKRDAIDPYLTFAKSQLSASADSISGVKEPSEETTDFQRKMAEMMGHSEPIDLMEQALRARRRLCNFNKRYRQMVS